MCGIIFTLMGTANSSSVAATTNTRPRTTSLIHGTLVSQAPCCTLY
jgi:hypothetical protein